MVKNKKVIKRDTDTDTDTDTENDKKVMTSKVGKAKKTKLYMILAVVLFIVAAFMWYRKKSKAKLQAGGQVPVQTQVMQQRPVMQSMQSMPAAMPQMQMGGMQQRLNPIQEIQLTQQMH
jgi:1,4-dihydroxy-2-naphthoate octaprenyltransferase